MGREWRQMSLVIFTRRAFGLLACSAAVAAAQPPEPDPDAPVKTRREAAAEAKAMQDAEWGINRLDPAAVRAARTAPYTLLAGLALNIEERASVFAIRRKYMLDLNAMCATHRAREAAGEADPMFTDYIDMRRERLRTELRDVLTTLNQVRLDRRQLGSIKGR